MPFWTATARMNQRLSVQWTGQGMHSWYIISRRSETTILKVLTLLGESKVFTNADATISLDDLKDPNGQPKNSPGPAVPIGTR